MGNSASSGRGHHEEMVDFGYLTPQGIYTGPRDWNQDIVSQLIVNRKLAPFYRPLEDYEENWDDEQILAARKEPPEPEGGESSRAESISSSSTRGHAKKPSAVKEPARHPEAAIYRGAVECPICFLYYPSNINHSRCCDQAICTECFVQIKRADPTTTHLVSEPASCPYCVQENFGIVYTPPPWRAGLGSEGATPPSWPDSPKAASDAASNPTTKRRRKSFGYNDPEVVTVDHIHPDWEAKLASVRAAVARRANRRIIMRQVGDRLIPVGVTSGRVHALPAEDGGSETPEGGNERGSRRRRRQNQEINQFLGSMGIAGQDLEELMVMEAMRLSLLEHEAQQRRQKEEEEKKKKEEAAATGAGAEAQTSTGPATTFESPLPAPPIISPAPSEQPTDDGTPASRSRTSTSSAAHTTQPLSTPPGSLPIPINRLSIDGRRSGRSTPTSPYGTISAAVLSATSTASALTSPSPTREQSDPLAAAAPAAPSETITPAPVPEPAVPSVTDTVPEPIASEPVTQTAVREATAERGPDAPELLAPISAPREIEADSAPETLHVPIAAQEADLPTPPPVVTESSAVVPEPSSEQTADRPPLSEMPQPVSVASSATLSSYDVLPSSPESTASDGKPLLDAAIVPPTPAAEGEPSPATAS